MGAASIGRRALTAGLLGLALGCGRPDDPDGRPPTAYGALRDLEQKYVALEQRAERLQDLAADSAVSERLRIEAAAISRELGSLQGSFEITTAALSTEQLSAILPMWERIALAQAGFALLQEDAAGLEADPRLTGAEVRSLAEAISAVAAYARVSGQTAVARLTGRLRIVRLRPDGLAHDRALVLGQRSHHRRIERDRRQPIRLSAAGVA